MADTADTKGVDPSNGHIIATGEIAASIKNGNWDRNKGYNPQQALTILQDVSAKVQSAQTAVQKLVPELQGANTNDAAVAVREATYAVLYASFVLSSLVGDNAASIMSSAAISERTGTSFDYTDETDTALKSLLGPNYAQYEGKQLPSIEQQNAANGQAQQGQTPVQHVVVDNLDDLKK